MPSTGIKVIGDVEARTIIVLRSVSAGLVQVRSTREGPAVAVTEVTFAGDALSTVTVAEVLSKDAL